MPKSPQDVYARHLLSPRGYPLWTPEPSQQLLAYRRDGLRIGDVGVVIPEDGCFDVFFNICLPEDHPFHRATGVPDSFQPIRLDNMDIRTVIDAENPGRILSNSSVKSVRTVERPMNSSSRTGAPGMEYDFTLSSSEGALLILPEGAERHDLRNYNRFLEVAKMHGADWYRFAEEKVGQIIGSDSLYLITGFYKSSSWSLAAFEKTGGSAEHSAQFRISPAAGENIAATYAWDTTRTLDWRVGPRQRYEFPNQAVFIRGFKIALRTGLFGKKWISVKADHPSARPNPAKPFGPIPGDSRLTGFSVEPLVGGSTQPSGSETQDRVVGDLTFEDAPDDIQALAVGEHVVIYRIPDASQAFHPSDIINQCLLNQVPSAKIAITHDDVWMSMLEETMLQAEDLAQEGHLETLVSQKYIFTSEGGAAYLQSRRLSESKMLEVELDESMTLDFEHSDVTSTEGGSDNTTKNKAEGSELHAERRSVKQFMSSGRGGSGNIIRWPTADLEAHPLTAAILNQHVATQAQYEQWVRSAHAKSNLVRSSGRGGSGNISRSRSQGAVIEKDREKATKTPDGAVQAHDADDRSTDERGSSQACTSDDQFSRESRWSSTLTAVNSVTSDPLSSSATVTESTGKRQSLFIRWNKAPSLTGSVKRPGSPRSPSFPTYAPNLHASSSVSSSKVSLPTPVILEDDREYVSFLEL